MDELKRMAGDAGIALEDEMLGQFECYREMLLDWNKRINLTAITDPHEVVIKHFLDSILLLRWGELPGQARLADIGTGAGFPGIPLKIARPDLQLTLLDSLNKRVNFLEAVSRQLGQENRCIHGRAEELAHRPEHREQYDLATARAVASLPALCEYCLPFVKVGGMFLAMKGPDNREELEQSQQALEALGGCLEDTMIYTLPDGSGRTLYCIRKRSQTPSKYPRKKVKITKAPL